MIFDLNRYSWHDFKHETRQLLALALPMMFGQIATVGIGVVDTMMAGAAGKDDLSAVALGAQFFLRCSLLFSALWLPLIP